MERKLVYTGSYESHLSVPSHEWTDSSHNSSNHPLCSSKEVIPLSSSSPPSSAPMRYRNLADIYNCSFALTASDPKSFEEVSKYTEWMAAMEDEM